jgi:lipoate-protein ligase A
MTGNVRDRWRNQDWQLIGPLNITANENLALDEVLTERVGKGLRKPTLRLWQFSDAAVILGRFQSVQNEVNEDVAKEGGVGIVRRVTGGGAILALPDGAISYSIYVPDDFVQGMSFAESYEMFDSWVIGALGELGVNAWDQGLNDITSDLGKLGGAAQARKHGAVLHHTMIAYGMNSALLGQVLRVGKEKLSDKGIRSAETRVGPLQQQIQLDREDVVNHFIGYFRSQFGLTDDTLTPEEEAEMRRLATEKFASRDWVYFLP